MQIIRKHAVVRDGLLLVAMPDSLNNRQVEVNVVIDIDEPVIDSDTLPIPHSTVEQVSELSPRKKANLGHLVGSWDHLTPEQKQQMNNQFAELRASWERDSF